jgi:hypothetical protein
MRFVLICLMLCIQTKVFCQKSPAILKAAFSDTLKESSALVYTSKGIFTLNDGKTNTIYKIDTTTGSILQKIVIANTAFIDAEALAADENFIYIGDVGNNDGRRDDLKIIRIPLHKISNAFSDTIVGEIIKYSYADMESYPAKKEDNNFDCEAMIATKTNLYLFTKRRGDNTTQLYFLPKTPGTYKAQPLANFNVFGLVTDATLRNDGKTLLLIGYAKGHKESFVWKFTNVQDPNFFTPKPLLIKLNRALDEWQTEAICFMPNNQVFITCEKAGSYKAGLYVLREW